MKEYFKDRPFYFNPPWNILFELGRLNKLRPWDVNIAYLLDSFMKKMESLRKFDFKASGVALDSSATIYLTKTSLLLELQKPPPSPSSKPDFEPSLLLLPARFELTSTTVKNLLEALEAVLKGEHLLKTKPKEEYILPLPPTRLLPSDIYLLEIEKMMEDLYKKLLNLFKKGKTVVFSKLVEGLDKLETIRTFIVLLFLAQKGKVDLWQDENLEEVYITRQDWET